jgi:hypothetical protein
LNKLNGALKIYALQDIMIGVLPLLMIPMFLYFGVSGVEDIKYNSQFDIYVLLIPMIVASDYIVSFSIRYIMHSNFSSSRKLFYKANVITLLLKSFFLSAIICLLLAMEKVLCFYQNLEYKLQFFNREISLNTLSQKCIFFAIIFSVILFIYTLSFLLSSTERLQVLIFFIIIFLPMFIWIELFKEHYLYSSFNYIFVSILILLSMINLFFAYEVIKRKTKLGTSFLVKFMLSSKGL